MKRFLLIGDEGLDIDLFKLKKFDQDIKCYSISNREVQLRLDDEIIKIEAVNMMINQYGDQERKIIPFENPKILLFTYSSENFALTVISDKELPSNLYVDDFKHICKIAEYTGENK